MYNVIYIFSYSLMQSDGSRFIGDVVFDSINEESMNEDNILE